MPHRDDGDRADQVLKRPGKGQRGGASRPPPGLVPGGGKGGMTRGGHKKGGTKRGGTKHPKK